MGRGLAVVLVILLGGGPVLAQLAPANKPDWRGTGVVLALLPAPSSLHETRPVIVIQHDPIKGLMEESMTHPFIVASPDLFRDLRPGDRIAFGLKDVPGVLLVVMIERLGPRR